MLSRPSLRRGVAALAATALLAAGCASEDEPRATPTTSPSPGGTTTTELTFAVYGPEPVVAAYKRIAATYTVQNRGTKVVVEDYANHDEALRAVRRGIAAGDPPDLFLMDHDDLSGLAEDDALRRVDDLLAEREIDFGDGYTRNGLEAFSADAALRCFPLDVSPLVVYYNPKLIELDQIAEPGEAPVTQEDGWSMEEFRQAARQARSPGVRGLHVAPNLEQVAPFIWSGGGEIVDDVENPTTLTLADDASREALQQLLEIVRNPGLTFSKEALRKRSALERFTAGQLGMILGFRDLTPVLREQAGLTFDVMPLPKVGRGATIATMSGLCLSSASEHTEQAADFLAMLISEEGAAALAATGYVMPANIDVLNSETFQQTGERPLHADVFTREVRDTQLLPSPPRWPIVRRSVAGSLSELFYEPLIGPLQTRLEAIDAASVSLFDPTQQPSPSISPTPGSSGD